MRAGTDGEFLDKPRAIDYSAAMGGDGGAGRLRRPQEAMTGDPKPLAGSVSRRAVLVSAAVALLPGCGDSTFVRALKSSYDLTLGKEVENTLTRAQIDENPYARIEVRIGKRVLAVLVLQERAGPDLLWRSADDGILQTRSWRLVKTVSLPTDIAGTEFLSPDPLAEGLHKAASGTRTRRIVDFRDPGRYGRVVTSRFEHLGSAPVTIVGRTYPTRLAREVNHVEVEDWEYENRYWFDPATGIVWRSVQHVDRWFPPLRISVLKPPAANV